MYRLVAGSSAPEWSGEMASETFDDLEAAHKRMREWALFGVDAYCNDPDVIWIADAQGEPVSYWDWRNSVARRPDPEPAGGPS